MTYQDQLLPSGQIIPGTTSCADRWALIAPLLRQYHRRLTILDLGASEAYFAIAATREQLDAVWVLVEADPFLRGRIEAAALPRTIVLQHRMTPGDLARLAECEHFDVVLALNVLHWFEAWEPATRAVLALGEQVIIEVPPTEDLHACGQAALGPLNRLLEDFQSIVLGTTPSHVTPGVRRELRLYAEPKTRLRRSYLDVPPGGSTWNCPDLQIASSLETKTYTNRGRQRDWIAGINLRTYEGMGGVWPPASVLSNQILWLPLIPGQPHGDIRPWNVIIDGERVYLIDRDDPNTHDSNDQQTLAETAASVLGKGRFAWPASSRPTV